MDIRPLYVIIQHYARNKLTPIIMIFFTLLPNTYADLSSHFAYNAAEAKNRWKTTFTRLIDKPFTCPSPLEPKITFSAGSIYKDTPCKCEIDPDKKAKYEQEVKSVYNFAKSITSLSDLYVATPTERNEIAQCVAQQIELWAYTDAMLGEHPAPVGYHKSAQVLGAVSLTYLKLQEAENVDYPSVNNNLGQWLRALSQQVIDYYENMAGPNTSNNNHRYWDSYHIGTAAIVLNDTELFSWAMQGLEIGINQIQENGTLPLEIQRGDRAHAYHLYALQALTGLAELAIKNKSSMPIPYYPYSKNNGALTRLSNLLLNEELDKSTSVFPIKIAMKCHQSAWMEIYLRHSGRQPSIRADLATYIKAKRNACRDKLYYTYLGGNMSLYYGIKNLDAYIP